MSSEKGLALMLIVVSAYCLYLNSQNKLEDVLSTIVTNPASITGASFTSIGKWTLAFIAYLGILQILSPAEGIDLTILLALGALYVDYKRNGSNALIKTL